jgi:hypothetical protein
MTGIAQLYLCLRKSKSKDAHLKALIFQRRSHFQTVQSERKRTKQVLIHKIGLRGDSPTDESEKAKAVAVQAFSASTQKCGTAWTTLSRKDMLEDFGLV